MKFSRNDHSFLQFFISKILISFLLFSAMNITLAQETSEPEHCEDVIENAELGFARDGFEFAQFGGGGGNSRFNFPYGANKEALKPFLKAHVVDYYKLKVEHPAAGGLFEQFEWVDPNVDWFRDTNIPIEHEYVLFAKVVTKFPPSTTACSLTDCRTFTPTFGGACGLCEVNGNGNFQVSKTYYGRITLGSVLQCPNGYISFGSQCKLFDENLRNCSTEAKPAKNLNKNCEGNPCNVGNGNKHQVEMDYQGTGIYPINFKRYYNSVVADRDNIPYRLRSQSSQSFGIGWRSNYSAKLLLPSSSKLAIHASTSLLMLLRPNGSIIRYDWPILEKIDVDIPGKLIRINDSTWHFINEKQETEEYENSSGLLRSITSQNGFKQRLIYDLPTAEGGDSSNESLDKVIDHFGRELKIMNSGRQVDGFIDPDGKEYHLEYSGHPNWNLISITFPDETPNDDTDNPKRLYHYEDTNFLNALTGITDENGNRFATWTYDTQGRAISSEHAGGAERVDIVYNNDGTSTVTDSLGRNQTYHFDIVHGVVKSTQVEGLPCEGCPAQYQAISYDENGYVSSRTDFNGNVTNFIHNARGLQTSRTEAAGTADERTITTQWHPDFRLPIKITAPGQIITMTYDAQSRLKTREVTEQ